MVGIENDIKDVDAKDINGNESGTQLAKNIVDAVFGANGSKKIRILANIYPENGGIGPFFFDRHKGITGDEVTNSTLKNAIEAIEYLEFGDNTSQDNYTIQTFSFAGFHNEIGQLNLAPNFLNLKTLIINKNIQANGISFGGWAQGDSINGTGFPQLETLVLGGVHTGSLFGLLQSNGNPGGTPTSFPNLKSLIILPTPSFQGLTVGSQTNQSAFIGSVGGESTKLFIFGDSNNFPTWPSDAFSFNPTNVSNALNNLNQSQSSNGVISDDTGTLFTFSEDTIGFGDTEILETGNNVVEKVAVFDQNFTFTVSSNFFTSSPNASILNFIKIIGLPNWLSFDAETGIFSGVPDVNSFVNIKVVAIIEDENSVISTMVGQLNIEINKILIDAPAQEDLSQDTEVQFNEENDKRISASKVFQIHDLSSGNYGNSACSNFSEPNFTAVSGSITSIKDALDANNTAIEITGSMPNQFFNNLSDADKEELSKITALAFSNEVGEFAFGAFESPGPEFTNLETLIFKANSTVQKGAFGTKNEVQHTQFPSLKRIIIEGKIEGDIVFGAEKDLGFQAIAPQFPALECLVLKPGTEIAGKNLFSGIGDVTYALLGSNIEQTNIFIESSNTLWDKTTFLFSDNSITSFDLANLKNTTVQDGNIIKVAEYEHSFKDINNGPILHTFDGNSSYGQCPDLTEVEFTDVKISENPNNIGAYQDALADAILDTVYNSNGSIKTRAIRILSSVLPFVLQYQQGSFFANMRNRTKNSKTLSDALSDVEHLAFGDGIHPITIGFSAFGTRGTNVEGVIVNASGPAFNNLKSLTINANVTVEESAFGNRIDLGFGALSPPQYPALETLIFGGIVQQGDNESISGASVFGNFSVGGSFTGITYPLLKKLIILKSANMEFSSIFGNYLINTSGIPEPIFVNQAGGTVVQTAVFIEGNVFKNPLWSKDFKGNQPFSFSQFSNVSPKLSALRHTSSDSNAIYNSSNAEIHSYIDGSYGDPINIDIIYTAPESPVDDSGNGLLDNFINAPTTKVKFTTDIPAEFFDTNRSNSDFITKVESLKGIIFGEGITVGDFAFGAFDGNSGANFDNLELLRFEQNVQVGIGAFGSKNSIKPSQFPVLKSIEFDAIGNGSFIFGAFAEEGLAAVAPQFPNLFCITIGENADIRGISFLGHTGPGTTLPPILGSNNVQTAMLINGSVNNTPKWNFTTFKINSDSNVTKAFRSLNGSSSRNGIIFYPLAYGNSNCSALLELEYTDINDQGPGLVQNLANTNADNIRIISDIPENFLQDNTSLGTKLSEIKHLAFAQGINIGKNAFTLAEFDNLISLTIEKGVNINQSIFDQCNFGVLEKIFFNGQAVDINVFGRITAPQLECIYFDKLTDLNSTLLFSEGSDLGSAAIFINSDAIVNPEWTKGAFDLELVDSNISFKFAHLRNTFVENQEILKIYKFQLNLNVSGILTFVSGNFNETAQNIEFIGTLKEFNKASVLYKPEENFVGTEELQIIVSDVDTGEIISTKAIQLNILKVAPRFTNVSGNGTPVVFTEGEGSIVVLSGVNFSIEVPEGRQIQKAEIQFINSSFVSDEDQLEYVFNPNRNIIGSFNNGILTLSGVASGTDYQAALQEVFYNNSSATPNTSQRDISFTIEDTEEQQSDPIARAINVNETFALPIITGPDTQDVKQGDTIVFAEANNNRISISDIDSRNSTVNVTFTLTNSTGSLEFNSQPVPVPLPISIDSEGKGNLDTLTYTPPNITTEENVVLEIKVESQHGSTTKNINITLIPADALTITLPTSPQEIAEDESLNLPIGLEKNIIIPENVEFEITLFVVNGVLTLSQTTNLTFIVGSGSKDRALNFKGKFDDIKTAVSNLTYEPNLHFVGSDQLFITVYDLDTLLTNVEISQSLAINITAVNDKPQLSLPESLKTNEDTSLSIQGISFSDPDGDVDVTLTLTVINGVLEVSDSNGLTINNNMSPSIEVIGNVNAINDIIRKGVIFYKPNSHVNGQDQLSVTINDQGNVGAGNALSIQGNVPITIKPINDRPSITIPAVDVSLNEDTSADITGITFTDIDITSSNSTVKVEATVSVLNGILTLDSTNAITFINNTGQNQSTITIEGTIDDINNAITTITYTPNTHFHGKDRLHVIINDRGTVGEESTIPLFDVNANIEITVLEVNDPPQFSESVFKFQINSGVSVNTVVGKVIATDIDINDTITYDIENNNVFEINSTTGEIFVSDPTNLTQPSFNLEVTATDTNGFEANAQVEIAVNGSAPQLVTNKVLTVKAKIQDTVITSDFLDAEDLDNTIAAPKYTLTTISTLGTVSKDGVVLSINDEFTQDDIDSGKISYSHTSETKDNLDQFQFILSDELGNESKLFVFNIKIEHAQASIILPVLLSLVVGGIGSFFIFRTFFKPKVTSPQIPEPEPNTGTIVI